MLKKAEIGKIKLNPIYLGVGYNHIDSNYLINICIEKGSDILINEVKIFRGLLQLTNDMNPNIPHKFSDKLEYFYGKFISPVLETLSQIEETTKKIINEEIIVEVNFFYRGYQMVSVFPLSIN